MTVPESIATERLLLRRPRASDAEAIYARYASVPDVLRFVGWPMHRTLEDTRQFLSYCDDEWQRWPAGPYLILARADGVLLGSTGLGFERPYRASTGYVLARDAWGRGYATEAVRAMADAARLADVRRLYALCHTEHRASSRVLEKCGFVREAVLRRYEVFPNVGSAKPCDVFCYALLL